MIKAGGAHKPERKIVDVDYPSSQGWGKAPALRWLAGGTNSNSCHTPREGYGGPELQHRGEGR